MRPHGNRASSLFRRWRQRGGGKGKQNRGRWRNKRRRKRWRENRYLLSFHREDLKSEPLSWPGRGREEGGGQAGEDSECRDGVEECWGCCSLWDRDLQWPLSLCSVEQLGGCGVEVSPAARYTSAFYTQIYKIRVAAVGLFSLSCGQKKKKKKSKTKQKTCTVELYDGDSCLLTAHTSPGWGVLGSAGGCWKKEAL